MALSGESPREANELRFAPAAPKRKRQPFEHWNRGLPEDRTAEVPFPAKTAPNGTHPRVLAGGHTATDRRRHRPGALPGGAPPRLGPSATMVPGRSCG